jgi:hypothetical protein
LGTDWAVGVCVSTAGNVTEANARHANANKHGKTGKRESMPQAYAAEDDESKAESSPCIDFGNVPVALKRYDYLGERHAQEA